MKRSSSWGGEDRHWAISEYDAAHAVINNECAEAQEACSSVCDETGHHRQKREQHVVFMRREAEGRIEPVVSEAERRHDDAIKTRSQEAGTGHPKTAPAPRVEFSKSQAQPLESTNRVEDLDKRRMAMGSRLLQRSSAESALEAKCQTLQRHHVQRGNRESAIKKRTASSASTDHEDERGRDGWYSSGGFRRIV